MKKGGRKNCKTKKRLAWLFGATAPPSPCALYRPGQKPNSCETTYSWLSSWSGTGSSSCPASWFHPSAQDYVLACLWPRDVQKTNLTTTLCCWYSQNSFPKWSTPRKEFSASACLTMLSPGEVKGSVLWHHSNMATRLISQTQLSSASEKGTKDQQPLTSLWTGRLWHPKGGWYGLPLGPACPSTLQTPPGFNMLHPLIPLFLY